MRQNMDLQVHLGFCCSICYSLGGVLTVTMLDEGTAGYGVDVNLSVSAGTVTATNAANIDYVIGSID